MDKDETKKQDRLGVADEHLEVPIVPKDKQSEPDEPPPKMVVDPALERSIDASTPRT